MCGAHGRIRTSDRLVRSQVLYPAELHAHVVSTTTYLLLRLRLKLNLNSLTFIPLKNGGEGGIRTLDRAINPILP
jgi:hypothetical protein